MEKNVLGRRIAALRGDRGWTQSDLALRAAASGSDALASGARARSPARMRAMAFGQQSGPPATARQVQQLTALLHAAGHTDFRDARGPLGLTQRQAGGKFTRDEADALIARLEEEAERTGDDTPSEPPRGTPPIASEMSITLRKVPAELLAAELQRRGWAVMEP